MNAPTYVRYDDMDYHASLWQSCLEALAHLISVIIPMPTSRNVAVYNGHIQRHTLEIQQMVWVMTENNEDLCTYYLSLSLCWVLIRKKLASVCANK